MTRELLQQEIDLLDSREQEIELEDTEEKLLELKYLLSISNSNHKEKELCDDYIVLKEKKRLLTKTIYRNEKELQF